MTTQLQGPEQPPKSGNKPKQLVFLLHGLGADGNDLIGLAPHFSDLLPDAHFFSPHAPFPCDMAPMGRQWFSLAVREEQAILDGLEQAAPIVNAFIDQQQKVHGITDDNTALIGFSQGSMLAMHVALRRDKELACVLAYSGALMAADKLKQELTAKPPICLVHGEDDPIVPFEAFLEAKRALSQYQVPMEAYSRKDLGHGIDPAGMQIGGKFLENALVA